MKPLSKLQISFLLYGARITNEIIKFEFIVPSSGDDDSLEGAVCYLPKFGGMFMMKKKKGRLFIIVCLWGLLIFKGLGRANGLNGDDFSSPSGIRFGLGLYGGKSYSALQDINDSLKGINARFNDLPDVVDFLGPSPQKINAGYEAGGEALVNLMPWLRIGVGAGYIQTSRENTFMSKWWWLGAYSYQDDIDYKVRAIYLSMNLHVVFPLWKRLNWTATVGVDDYFGRLNSNIGWSSLEIPTSYEETWQGTSTAVGFHGGLGLEFNVFSHLAFVVEGTARYAKLKDLKGDYRCVFRVGTEFVETEKDASLWYYDCFDPLSKKTYPALYIGRDIPSGREYQNVRKAVVDLSGFSIRAGFKIRLI